MARVRKCSEHEFSLKNDPVNPSVVVWRDATPAELGEYQAARSAAIVGGGPALTKAQAVQLAHVIWEFVERLIVRIRGWEFEEADGTVRDLAWPADKAQVLDVWAPGLMQAYKDVVIGAHYPGSVEAHATATGQVVFPNS